MKEETVTSFTFKEAKEVYVPVSVEENPKESERYVFVEDDGDVHTLFFNSVNAKWYWDSGYYDNVEPDILKGGKWLKKVKAIILEENEEASLTDHAVALGTLNEGNYVASQEQSQAPVATLACTSGNTVERAFRKGYQLGHEAGVLEDGYYEGKCWDTHKSNI